MSVHHDSSFNPHQLDTYDFHLPESAIATQPPAKRETARLLVCNRSANTLEDKTITDLPQLLPHNAVLVVNNSKVVPARLFGHKDTGGRVEALLLTPLPLLEQDATTVPDGWKTAPCSVLLRSAKRPKPGQPIIFHDDLKAEMLEEQAYGMATIELRWRRPVLSILESIGTIPLPPYMQRDANDADSERYQTVYANDAKAGSVAAPTAGLHLTPELKQALLEKGMDWVEVTLHVGYGTFSPVRAGNIKDHDMHAEFVELDGHSATLMMDAKAQGRPIVAVGTTSCRTLEGIWAQRGRLEAFAGWTDIFLYPGKKTQVVDQLITNFHLPKSTLFMLVCALAGVPFMQKAYAHAIESDYRFYSYGDAMYIL